MIFTLAAACLAATAGYASERSPAPAANAVGVPPYASLSPDDQVRMAWWIDARYGMFLHFGVASIPGVELSWARKGSKPLDVTKDPAGYVEDPVYDNLYKQFNPSEFDAKKWVEIAKAAGMKYMVLTAKHHDGFCLWDTKGTDYKITNTPFKRDIVKEFTDACHAAGMKVGLYYSPRDWHHPDYGIGDNKKYIDYMNGQLTELLSNYGKIDVIWFDSYGKGDLKDFWKIDSTWQLIKKLAPQIIVNNRLAILGRYNQQPKAYIGDMDTPEQQIGKMQTTRPWESCMCFVGHQWGYKPNGEMYTLDKLIRAIVSCATGDGNLLMNVGPMPTGQIEPRQAERLKEAGDWLGKYGKTIYGTRGGPYENALWGGATRKGNSVYIHVFNWKGTDTLRLLPLPQKVVASSVLTGGTVTVKQTASGLDLTVPAGNHDPIDTIIELTLDAPSVEMVSGPSLRSIFDDGTYGKLISDKALVTASSSGKGDDPKGYARLVGLPPVTKGSAVTTDQQADPAVTIDLGAGRMVKGVYISPLDGAARKMAALTMSLSQDGTTWTEAWKCPSVAPYYEIPVTRLVAGAQVPGAPARYIKLMIKSPKSQISLRRVEVYGE